MTQRSLQTACLPRSPRQLPKWARRRTPFYVFLSGSIVTLAAAIVIALQQQLLSLTPFVFALIFGKLALAPVCVDSHPTMLSARRYSLGLRMASAECGACSL